MNLVGTLIGAVVGNAVVPGFGGVLGGAVAGNFVGKKFRWIRMIKKKSICKF